MPAFIDARLPVRLDGAARPGAAYLLGSAHEAPAGEPSLRFTHEAAHAPGCACCGGRSPAAAALAALFQDRARGRAPVFTSVVVRAGDAGQEAVREALRADPLASAYFRLA